jgi:hypothetical protein
MVRILACLATLLGITLTFPAVAQATPEQDYFSALAYNDFVVWDYPGILNTGYAVCQVLWENVNPYPGLVSMGYDPGSAATIITTAQATLCPGYAVTGPPESAPAPKLLMAT